MINTVILSLGVLITALSPIILAVINRNQKAAAVRAADAVETVRLDLASNSANTDAKLEHIKDSVNSERTAMIERIEALHAEVLALRMTPDGEKGAVPAAVQNIRAKEP